MANIIDKIYFHDWARDTGFVLASRGIVVKWQMLHAYEVLVWEAEHAQITPDHHRSPLTTKN